MVVYIFFNPHKWCSLLLKSHYFLGKLYHKHNGSCIIMSTDILWLWLGNVPFIFTLMQFVAVGILSVAKLFVVLLWRIILYFIAPLIDHNKELNKIEKSSQEYSSNCEDGSSEQVNDVRGTSSDAEQAQVECSTEENFLSPESLEYTTESRTLDDDIGLKRGQNVMHLKRKRNEVDMVSDSSAVVASKETCVSQADVNPLSPARSTGICGDKKQRYWIIQYLFGFRSLEFRSVNDLKVIKWCSTAFISNENE